MWAWIRPCGTSLHGSMVLAIFVPDEHSCVEKLSVSPQAGLGQRGSGHVSQRGTKLHAYLSAQDPGSFASFFTRAWVVAAARQRGGEQTSWPVSRGLSRYRHWAKKKRLRNFIVSKAEQPSLEMCLAAKKCLSVRNAGAALNSAFI